jgi:hypothetical protein
MARTEEDPKRLPDSARTDWKWTLESIIRKLRVHTLKAQLALRHLICESLAKEFETALTFERRAALARKWDVTLKEGHVFQLMLDLLERQERESS